MKTKIFSYLIAGAAISFAACQGNGNGADNMGDSTSIQSSPDNTGNNENRDTASMNGNMDNSGTAYDKDTRDFVMEAADGGMAEVEMGRLAQQKASNPRVKAFGAMMVKDHTAANNDLKNTVQGKITIPSTMSDKHQRHMSDLQDKTGSEFDREYMKMMVDDHETDVRKFEDIAKNSKDPDVKQFATKTLPVLRTHLDSAKAIRNDLSKMKK
jgi:putative membrane protein